MKLIWGLLVAVFVAYCAVIQGTQISLFKKPMKLDKTVQDFARLAKRGWVDVSRCEMGTSEHHCWPQQCPTTNDEVIQFQQPFDYPPSVIVAFGLLDVDNSHNLRVNSSAKCVTKDCFTLHFNSWSTTIVWNYKLVWIACD